MTEAKPISLKPEDLSHGGGGILADTNTRWDKVCFGMETYKGKSEGGPVVAFMVEYTDLDTGLSADPESGTKYQQSWSTGSAHDCVPSPDGKQLLGTKAPRDNSSYGMLMEGLGNAIGAEELSAHIIDDITVLQGMECHMFQMPDTRGIKKKRKDERTGKEYDPTIPMVDRVMVKPWDKKAGTAASADSAGDDALKAKATVLIKEILAGTPAGLDRNTIVVQVFQKADSDQAALAQLISNDNAFVSGIEGVTFDGNILKLAG